MDQPSPERCASLKAHKSLPRRRPVSDEVDDYTALKVRKARRSYTSPDKEEQITSWIRDSSPPTPTDATFLLPLTPPEDAMDNAETVVDVSGVDDSGDRQTEVPARHPRTVSGSTTPVNNRSLPTPELTPPRKLRMRTPSPPLRRKNRISLSPPPTSRQTSSKAESFKTAPEVGSPKLTSASVATFHTLNDDRGTPSPEQLSRNVPETVGLGLGFPSDHTRMPAIEVPTVVFSSPSPAKSLLDSRHATPSMVKTDPLVAGDIPAVRELARDSPYVSRGEIFDADDESLSAITYIRDDDTSYRERSFAEDVERHFGDNGLAESDLSSKRSVSPLSDESDLDPLMARAKMDSKRFSQISNLSIPHSVEVVVIDNSPVRHHKLRHFSKNTSLRAASSSHGGSNRSSLQSAADVKPRLSSMLTAHNNKNNSNKPTSSSLHSDSGISMTGSDHIMRRWSKMPYTEIPRRVPSMTRSLPLSSQRYISPRESNHGSRPSTASHSSNILSQRNVSQTLSDASTLTRELDAGRGRQMIPPAIPKRSSSLGVTANRQLETEVSALSSSASKSTAAQIKGHGRSVSQPFPQPRIVIEPEPEPDAEVKPELEPSGSQMREIDVHKMPALGPLLTEAKTTGSGSQSPRTPLWMRRSSDASDIRPLPVINTRNTTPRRSSKEDTALVASRALLKTPFSGMSIQSSASGYMEVHEATAVNIYPHTNSSLLVIQQASQGSVQFPAHPAVRPGARRITEISTPSSPERAARNESVYVKVNGPDGNPVISHIDMDGPPERVTDSPLQNPRPAPSPKMVRTDDEGRPPAVKLIPPTPLNEPTGARTSTGATNLISGPMALVKRALSVKRPQIGTAPRGSGLWLSSSRKSAGHGVTKKRKSRPTVSENNLSPFWRPRRFWEDSDETPSDDEGADLHRTNASGFRARDHFYQLGSGKFKASKTNPADNDYFGKLPVRNTLGFPQQRVVISGPSSLVRRLSSIRRRRVAVETAWADPKLNLSGSAKPPTTLPQPGAGSSTNLAVARAANPRASPSPSAMSRQNKMVRRIGSTGAKRRVRFEFHPMRGLSGGSGESKEWRTKGMVKRLKETRDRRREERQRKELERIEKRRQELRSLIGKPKLNSGLVNI